MTRSNTSKSYFLRDYVKGEALYNFWATIEKVLTAASVFFILSSLDVFKYGTYILLFSFYHLTANILLRPLQEVIFNDVARFSAEGKLAEAKKLYLESLVLKFIFALLLFLGVFWSAGAIAGYYGQDVTNLLRLLAVLYLIDASYTSMRMFFRLRLKFGLIAIRPVIFKAVRFILILLFLTFSKFGIREAVISHVAASFAAAAILAPFFFLYYRSWTVVRAARQGVLWGVIKRHGKWPIWGAVISRLVANIRPWAIKFFVNTEGVAIYSVAESLYGALKNFFPSATLSALIPRELANRKRCEEILVRGTKYLTIIGLLIALVGWLFVPPLVRLLLPHYVAALPLYLALLFLLPVLSFRIMSVTFLVALRRQKFLFLLDTAGLLGGIVLPLLLLYSFGLWGMPIERILQSVIIATLMFWYLVRKEYPMNFFRRFFRFDHGDRAFAKKIFSQLNYSRRNLRRTFSGLFFD